MDSAAPLSAFARLLRRYRLEAGLTQEDLAERAGLSWRTISDLERGINHRPHRHTLLQVAEALALPPAQRTALQQAARHPDTRAGAARRAGAAVDAPPAADGRAEIANTGRQSMTAPLGTEAPCVGAAPGATNASVQAAQEAVRGNLPAPLTSFIGRRAEQRDVVALLRTAHLVTLTGTGGAGKTRLALRVAADMAVASGSRVWFVDLAPLADPMLVTPAVAAVLSVREVPDRPLLDSVAAFLHGERVLLVLDNCEHLVAACAALAELLLRRCPDLRVLATSRTVLSAVGEVAWRVPSLSVPARGHPPAREPDALAAVQASEAVALFVERARAVQPSFTLTAENAPVVAQICAYLDGLPLAVELAAARVKVLSVDQIAHRLDDRFRLLTGGSRTMLPRQQTLRATMDWSYTLLSPPEQALLCWLSPFAGSFDLEAVEAICDGGAGEGNEVIDLLSGLVDKSLVLTDVAPNGAVRYRLLETVRQYAEEKLRARQEEEPARERHLHLFLTLAEHAYTGRTDAPAAWLERLEREHDNLRAALAWTHGHDPESYLELAGSLAWFWQLHSHYAEGHGHLTAALAVRRGAARAVARALWGVAILAGWQGDAAASRAAAAESLHLWRELGDQREVALALEGLGWTHFFAGDDAGARHYFMESLETQQALGDPRLINRARLAVCLVLVSQEELDTAGRWAEEALRAAREQGDEVSVHQAYHYLGDCALIGGEVIRAEGLYAESLRAAHQYGDILECTYEVQGMAMAMAGQGRPVKALRLASAAAACLDQLGITVHVPFWDALLDRYLGQARDLLGSEAAARVWDEGQLMTFEHAVADALDRSGE